MPLGTAGKNRVYAGLTVGTEAVALIKTDGNEVSGGGYSRQAAPFAQSTEQGNTDNWTNTGAIDFGTATANWGTINKFRIYASTTSTDAAQIIYEGGLTQATVNSGSSVSFAQGAIAINAA